MPNFEFIQTNEDSSFNLLPIIKSGVIAIAISLIIFLILSGFCLFTNVAEVVLNPIIFITTLLSVILAGLLSGRRAKKTGWLYGISSAFVYIFIMLILSLIFVGGPSFSQSTVTMLVFCLLLGAGGGVVGINTRRR